MEILSIFFGIALVALAVIFAVTFYKKALITHSVSVTRITQDGEQVVITGNFTVGMTHEQKREKLFEMAQLGDDRLKIVDERFKALLAEQRAKQEKKDNV